MEKRTSLLAVIYDKVVLGRPRLILLGLLVAIAVLGYKARDFKLDASTQTLILETDQDFVYSKIIASRYGSPDYLLLVYMPEYDLFSAESLADLSRLRDELRRLKGISSVVSILDVPLLESAPGDVRENLSEFRTLESPTVDRRLARIEFGKSPLYQNLLVSPDLKTTALQIQLQTDEQLQSFLNRRDILLTKKANGSLTATEAGELNHIAGEVENLREENKRARHRIIAEIRSIMNSHRAHAQLFLGGVDMIADDMISFIKKDLKIFGIGVLIFLILTLSLVFRNSRWVILPVLCCAFSAISMMGILGLFGWQVTVISSNFISLQLIFTMAITIHLIVRYRDLALTYPDAGQRFLIFNTVRLMAIPCLYAALTTIAGFGSLLLCDILPVKTFGWMMIAGICVSMAVTFLLFPAGLMTTQKKPNTLKRVERKLGDAFTYFLAEVTANHGTAILVASGIILVFGIVGISKLVVENSFIDYFKESTEIHRGLKAIDQKLGGTTPLDIIIDVDAPELSRHDPKNKSDANSGGEFDEFKEFDHAPDDGKYWFTADKMAQIVKIHNYLDSLPETGKVMSLATLLNIAENLNGGRPLDNFQLALLYGELPDSLKAMMVKPYVSVAHNQLRFAVRVKDSEKSLRRNELLKKIRNDLVNQLGLRDNQVHLTGLLVLYNNMLQSLFDSQILTLGVVVLVLLGMFLILFRSLKIALIALAPNLLAIAAVLGVMGWLNIPLDMMTITIAAISMGIAVDNTIHYIYRFKQEFSPDRGYVESVFRSHGSIGQALFYTSVTIIVGFSILALSNFIPSIYFGLLTGLAMLMALLGSLTLLPELLIFFKPLGPESKTHQRFPADSDRLFPAKGN